MSLDPKTRELAAVGISVAINCMPCLDYHVKQARALGVEDKAMAEVIRMVRDMKVSVSSKLFQYAGQKLDQEILNCTGPKEGETRACC